MNTQNPLGYGLVYTNENNNVAVSKLVFESKDQALVWADQHLKFIGATRLRTTPEGVSALMGTSEVRWSLLELTHVPLGTKVLPALNLHVSYN